MTPANRIVGASLAAGLMIASAANAAEFQAGFEDAPGGAPPPGWRIETTNPAGGAAAAWAVESRSDAHGGQNVLTLTTPPERIGGATYNLIWTDAAQFGDVDIEVAVRANSGNQDQGGGPAWRVQDSGNYYVARYNQLERNFRIYFVAAGNRFQIASAEDRLVGSGEWFTVRIVHRGDVIEGYLNGTKLLEVRDTVLPNPGGIGLWTKADAATSFDDLRAREP